MFGLLLVAAFAVYLLISAGVVAWSIHFAKKRGKNAKLWGWGAALIMYNLVFWDWIPTVVTQQYYCAKESGPLVIKTLEQWKVENPSVMESLFETKWAPPIRRGDMENFIDTYFLNKRFIWVIKKNGPFLFNRWRWEELVVDNVTGQELIKYIDFSTGNGHVGGEVELRFWLHSNGCRGGNASMHADVYEYRKQLIGENE